MNVRAVLLPWLAGLLLVGVAGQATSAGDDASDAIHFHRILVPEDRIRDWPVGDGKYLPVDEKEFQRRLAEMRAPIAGSPTTPTVVVTSARYEAKLIGDDLVGQASADIVLTGKSPAMRPLEPCNLALAKATWDNPDIPAPTAVGRAVAPSTAYVGVGSNGKLEALVERSGRLRFEWSLAGRRETADMLSFLFEIPSAASNELSIELPKKLVPAIDSGVVVGSKPVGEDAYRWQIELGGCHRFHLRAVPLGESSQRPQLALLRESRTYDLSLRGMEVSTHWKLQAHNEPLRRLTVWLDPGLQLISARCGGASLSWSVVSGSDREGTRIILTLPDPIRDVERTIRLNALGQLVLDRPWRLPRIRAEGTSWQEGSITLLIPEPLVTSRITPLGCAQTGAASLSAPRYGETLQFQAFEPKASVELSLARRPATLSALSATAIELGDEEAVARAAASFRISGGSRFSLKADIAPYWTIDAVESMPPGAVAEWSVKPHSAHKQALTVRLNKGLSPSRPLRLVVTARRPFSPSQQKLAGEDFSLIRFHDVDDGKHLVDVRPTGGAGLKLLGAAPLKRLQADSLTSSELELFVEPPRDLLFEYDAQAKALKVSLVTQQAKYTGTIEIDAAVGQNLLRETCTMRCVPRSGRVDHVLVQFFPRRDTFPRWTLAGEGNQEISARKWSRDEQTAAGWDASLETWELTLRRPHSTPFEIVAVRENVLGDKQSGGSLKVVSPWVVTLASMPEAMNQRGILTIRRIGPGTLQIDNRRLQPVPPEAITSSRVQTVRGVYRYDPSLDVADGASAAIRVGDIKEPDAVEAWVWDSRLESWYQSDGAARHRASYDLQNTGRGSFRLTLPPNVARKELRGIWIDNEPVGRQRNVDEGNNCIIVRLPSDREFPRVSVEWTTSGRRLGIVGSLTPSLPMPDLPVLARYWTAWLPPGYEFSDSGTVSPSVCGSDLTWTHRLVGPLARMSDADRFDPLSAADWINPLADLWGHGRTNRTVGNGGWTAWRAELPAETPVSVPFVHCASVRLLGMVVFLMIAGVGCWKTIGRPMLLILLLGAFGVAALLLPSGYAVIASGGVLGIIFCLAWRWIHDRALPPVTSETPSHNRSGNSSIGSTASRSVRVGVILLVVLSSFFLSDMARGETPPNRSDRASEKRAATSPMYRVLVPIDAEKKPIGGKVYLPERFYQELYRHAAPEERPQGWLIFKAFYRGVLTKEPVSGRLAVPTLRIQYDLQVLGQATRVRIPLRTEGANLLPDSVLLDGRPIVPLWEPDTASLVFEVAEPGEYRLELSLRPTMRHGTGPTGFDVAIPRVARSQLELSLPDDAPPVEAPSAYGVVRLEKDPLRLLADLGPSDRLSVRWPESGAAGDVELAIDAEQLMWLKVQSGSVAITTRFKLRVVEGRLQQVQLAVDPRLRLLPLTGDNRPTVQTGAESGQYRLITFRWQQPVSDQVVLEATFLVSGATGVGTFRLPELELLNARTTKRWMAVSVDPALDWEQQPKQPLEAVAVSEFMKDWGAAETRPLAAYGLPAEGIDWTISTRPHEPRSTAEQVLSLTCDEDHVAVLFEAKILTTSGYRFQHQLAAPKGLKIEDVSLMEEDVDRTSRWSHDADGTITVFLNDAASGEQKLVLRGQLPIQMDKPWPLPPIRLERCQIDSATVRLFRLPSVLLTIEGMRPMSDAPLADDAVKSDLGRFVAAFSVDGSQPLPVTVAVRPNRPKIRAQEEVRAQWNGQAWVATMDSRLLVRDGVVDQIDIRAPAGWKGPYTVSPPGQLQVRETLAEGRRLVYRPFDAITDRFRLSITGPLELSRGDRPIVPDIALLHVDELERWFILSDRAKGQAIGWQTRNLRPISWPQQLAGAPDAKATAYEATGTPVEAILKPADSARPSAFVRLADVAMRWQTDGSCCGAAVFDVEPSGTGTCSLRLPKGYELLQVAVEGMIVTPHPVSDGNWSLSLTSLRLPQRIEVLFRGKLSDDSQGNRRTFMAPVLGDLPVRHALWTVIGPPSWIMSLPEGAAVTSPWMHELSRLKSVSATIESASAMLSDAPEVMRRWCPRWFGRFEVCRTAVQRELAEAVVDPQTTIARQTADAIEQQNAKVVKRIGAVALLKMSRASPTVQRVDAILRRPREMDQPSIQGAFEGHADSLTLDCQPAGHDSLFHRRIGAMAMVVLACLAAVGSAYKALGNTLNRWPHVTGVVLGLGWWLWLSPSILGLGIAVASVVAAGRERMKAKN